MEGSVSRRQADELHDGEVASSTFRAIVYGGAFVTGAIVMSFEMLGSRYLNPYFGSGIYTWASLISTVLAALTAGYFGGGRVADRHPSARVLGAAVLIGSAFILALPSFSTPLLEALLDAIDDIKAGSLASAFVLMFLSGRLLRRLLAVRDQAAAALDARVGRRIGRRLCDFDGRQHRWNARHHISAHSRHRHACDHVNARCGRGGLRGRADGLSGAPAPRQDVGAARNLAARIGNIRRNGGGASGGAVGRDFRSRHLAGARGWPARPH